MRTTATSVLARRITITSGYATLPYEAGWATEAVFFLQAEGEHPPLRAVAEISPDGITWLPWGGSHDLTEQGSIGAISLTNFGNWLRLSVTGATESRPARILVHLALKG